jgi:hypothetical protein
MDLPHDEGFYTSAVTTLPMDIDLRSLPLSAFIEGFELDHVYDPDCKLQPKSHHTRC